MHIMFIGNSYTYYNDSPSLFQALARSNGKEATVYALTKGGRELSENLGSDDIARQLAAYIRWYRFDVCILQEQSTLPIRLPSAFIGSVRTLAEKLRGRVDRFVLYETWGRKEGSPDLEANGWSSLGMTQSLTRSYAQAADAIGAAVSPVGQNFRKVYAAHPEIDLYAPDLTHPSHAGSCLAVLTHYYTVFGQFPANTQALALDEATLAIFRSAVET